MKLLMDGKNPLASYGGILFDVEDYPVQTISATSNQKYAPKVLYNSSVASTEYLGDGYEHMKKNKRKNKQKAQSNYYNNYSSYYSGYGRWDTYTYFKETASTLNQAVENASAKSKQNFHSIILERQDDGITAGKCSLCGKVAGVVFIPYAGEYLIIGKAVEEDCVSVKKVDTVSTKIQDKTVFTPVKTKGNFDVKLENYPRGVVSESGSYDEYC